MFQPYWRAVSSSERAATSASADRDPPCAAPGTVVVVIAGAFGVGWAAAGCTGGGAVTVGGLEPDPQPVALTARRGRIATSIRRLHINIVNTPP